jgi:orotidine-5'-phosphate decarboxylase
MASAQICATETEVKPRVLAQDRLIVALDSENIDAARQMVAELEGVVDFFKIGLVLQMAEGAEKFIHELLRKQKRVFLDYKYYDIPQTVGKAVERAAQLGVTFLTIHGSTDVIKEAVKAKGKNLQLFTVTVLTSMDAEDIAEMGYINHSVADLVIIRAKKALEWGCDGVIASAIEAERIKREVGSLLVVAPGIRQSDSPADDQKRTATPAEAIAAGADYLVVGRLITEPNKYGPHSTPKEAATAILQEMQNAFDKL